MPWHCTYQATRITMKEAMKAHNQVLASIISTLYRSLGMELVLRMAKSFLPGYDINRSMGFPPSVPVPAQAAAQRVVMDLYDAGFLLELVEWLVRADSQGVMGKQISVIGLEDIVDSMSDSGYLLDQESGLFYEDPRRQRTRGWGRLKAGQEYPITLLKLDIVRNSRLVRGNSKAGIQSAYDMLRESVRRIAEKRRGRMWLWEGDGGIAAFHYAHPAMSAVLCGMEILNDLSVYNLTDNPLDRDLLVRVAVHAGFVHYTDDAASLLREECVKELCEIEEGWTAPGSMSVSASIAPHIDGIIKDTLRPLDIDSPRELLGYSLGLAESACKAPKGRQA